MKRTLLALLLFLILGGQRLAAAELCKFIDERGGVHSVTDDELAKLPCKTVKVAQPDKQTAEYEGVELGELLRREGVALGHDLRGPRAALYVLIEAEDGYQAVLALAEVDPATSDRVFLLADRKQGAALPEKERPLRLVIPDEKRPVRWVRLIKKISIRSPAADKAKP